MHRVMARPFARQNQKDIPFVIDADQAHFAGCGGLVKDGQWLPDWGSTNHVLHWNGAKLLSVYTETLSVVPQYWLHVQFQQPGYVDAGTYFNDPTAVGTPARGMIFDTIEVLNAAGVSVYGPLSLSTATVTPSLSTTNGRGTYWEAKWQVGGNSFLTSGASFTLRIKDKGTSFAPPILQAYAMGVNLSGMEWAAPGVRYGQSTYPNLNYTPPRLKTMQYLASQGVTLARLPITWEMLQPTRNSTPLISAATLAAYNSTSPAQVYTKGAFWEVYAQAIDQALNDAQTAGIKLIIDLHNYCRYNDFIYDGSGNVTGLTNPADDVTPPYTTDSTKVHGTIFANAATTPSLPQSDFTDFWTKAATRWHAHPALGGYSLMNEPHDMPTATTNTAWNNPFISGNLQDYSIWTSYAAAAVAAIRAADATSIIYVGGNNYQDPMDWATVNPGFPIAGATNVIYDFHLYLDATSGGFRFDWDQEVLKGFSAGEGGATISTATGTNRIKYITDWKAANGNPPLACTEFGLPIELRASDLSIDQRWLDAGKATLDTLFNNNIQVFSWMGGDHWPIRGYPINHVPRFHQNQTVEPQVSAYMQAKLGTTHAVIFDEGPCYGTSVQTIKVVARGYLSAAVTLTVAADKGTLSKTTLTLAAGTNSQDTFTFTPPTDDKSTISYTRTGGGQVPPNRVFYSYTDPATKAGITAADAALAVVSKYGAALWLAQDAYTDYCGGAACAVNGDPLRAVSDKLGAASTIENPQEMVNWFNNEAPTSIRGIFLATTWGHDGDGFPAMDLTSGSKYGLYSKHLVPVNNPTATNPSNDNYPYPAAKSLFDLTDSHFGVVTFKISSAGTSGVLAAAQEMMGAQRSVLQLNAGKVEFDQFDTNSVESKLADTTVQALHAPCTASFVSTATAQKLRVNGAQVATGAHNWTAASPFSTLTWGGGHWNFFPQLPAQVHTHACIFGKGTPRDDEMGVLEAYLKTFEYTPPVLSAWETLLQTQFTAGNTGMWADNRTLSQYLDGGDLPPAAANGSSTIKRWINHGNTGNGHDYLELNAATRALLSKDAGNFIYLPGYSGAPIVGAGGGAMAACYGCVVIDWQSYYGTILSSMNAANVGIRVNQSADFGLFYFQAGTGAATVQATISNGLATFATPVGKVVVEFWYDGAHLNIRLNKGTVSQAVFSGNIAAGAADMTLFSNAGGGDGIGANTYGFVWLPGYCPNATDRDIIASGMALAYDGQVI